MEYNNILIIKMSSVGDVLHALPVAAALRSRYPKARISWLVHPQFAGFVPEPPIIDEIIYFDKVAFQKLEWGGQLACILEFRKELQQKKFDLVIDLQGLFKSAVAAFLTGCDTRIGYCEMREGSGLVSKAIKGTHCTGHVIERYLDVARYLGAVVIKPEFPLPDLTKEEAKVKELLKAGGMEFISKPKIVATGSFPLFTPEDMLDAAPYVVFVPGARWETKKWPQEYFAKLALMFIEEGFVVVLAGSKEEVREGEIILELAKFPKGIVDLTGKTTLRELAAVIKGAVFYVSADTGPLHLATALQKPCVAVYGPTRPDRTGPYGNKRATVVVAPIECAGCLKKQCSDWRCMHEITPEMVFAAYKKKMEAQHG